MHTQYLKLIVAAFAAVVPSVTAAFTTNPSKLPTTFKPTTPMTLKATSTDEVKVGDRIPSVVMREMVANGPSEEVNIADLIAGKKVAIFGVPGAFTPGCSKSHLPSFIDAQDELKAKGVEMTICIATNDVFVMEAWGRTSGGTDAGIRFLSDGEAALTTALGLLLDMPVMQRTKRFSLIADDGVVTEYFSADEETSNTWAPAMLAKL